LCRRSDKSSGPGEDVRIENLDKTIQVRAWTTPIWVDSANGGNGA
jgi:hypothetical protein